MPQEEDFHRSEIPFDKKREMDNEVRISKNVKMKRKLKRI